MYTYIIGRDDKTSRTIWVGINLAGWGEDLGPPGCGLSHLTC